MDDDHTFPESHLEKCLLAVSSDPSSVWTTGEIGYVKEEYYDTAATAFQLGPAGVGYPITDKDDNWAIADGSTIYPAEAFHRGLKFTEAFGYGSSYLEFGAYLYAHGYKSRCVEGVRVTHHADLETITRRPDPIAAASRLFAAICFNCYFRPDPRKVARFVLPSAIRLSLQTPGKVVQAWKLARQRWARLNSSRHAQ